MINLNALITFTLIGLSISGFGQCGPLSTAYNQNNGQDGIMFDVVALTSIEITNFDINCGGVNHNFEIYYRPGTHVGFENNPAGWNLIGAANNVNGPVNVATPIPAVFSVVLCAGDVGAFYVTSTGAGSIDYTNGAAATGNILAADANLQILIGTGKDYPFGTSFNPRSPNITAHYNCLTMSCCAVQSISVNTTACVGNEYSTSGTIGVMNPPATGTLTVSDCNGNQQILNPPFVAPINYNITNQTADGAACDITAVFSDDPTCTLTEAYTAPASCSSCSIDVFTVNVGNCDPNNNSYMINGSITVTDPPTTGTLVVQIDDGTNVTDTIINGPFVGPYNWSISGLLSNAAACVVTVYFSDDLVCTDVFNYVAPSPCECIAEIGSFTETLGGQGINNFVLCYGDDLTLTSNGDNVAPYEMFNPPGPAYDPGLGWLMYSCPPTVALSPDAILTFADDPCFLGYFGTGNFYDLNDLSTINSYPAGTFTDNIIYYLPVTMYSMATGTASYVNAGLPCYETGQIYAVQYLDDFTYTVTEDCQTSTAVITLNGAYPGVGGSDFTASALVPGTATFVNSTSPDGGTIQIAGLGNNQNYSLSISDGNGCTYAINEGPFPVLEDATFNYSSTNYCLDAGSIVPNITGTPGGTFTSSAGIVLNAATGEIQTNGSSAGNYTITYTTPDVICFTNSVLSIDLYPLPAVDAGLDQAICKGETVYVSGTGAITYVWDNGVADGNGFNPSTTSTYTVIGTDANGCMESDQLVIEVFERPSANFTLTPAVTTTENTHIYFNNTSSNAEAYSWNFGDGIGYSTNLDPDYIYPQVPANFQITLTASSNNGMCVDSITKQLLIEDVVTFYIPNSFTPNGDAFNNRFEPLFTSGYDAYDFHFTIFNRWGEIVFESYDASKGWDGNYGDGGVVDDGTYIWLLEFKANLSDKRYSHSGHVTVLK